MNHLRFNEQISTQDIHLQLLVIKYHYFTSKAVILKRVFFKRYAAFLVS